MTEEEIRKLLGSTNPFIGTNTYEDAFNSVFGNREPHLHEAQALVKARLLKDRSRWIKQRSIQRDTSLSERAVVASLGSLNGVRRARSKAGDVVWRLD